VDGKKVDIYGVSNLEQDTLTVGIKIDNKSFRINIKKDKDLILNVRLNDRDFTFVYTESFQFFIPNDNFNLIVNFLQKSFRYVSYEKKEDGYVVKLGEQFLKGIVEIILFLEKT